MTEDDAVATATMENPHDEPLAAESALDGVDEASDKSFPASDPPARTPITGIGSPCRSE